MFSETLKIELDKLNRAEKLRVVQLLVEQLASEEELLPSKEYEIWSPYDSAGAAAILTDMLEADRRKHGG